MIIRFPRRVNLGFELTYGASSYRDLCVNNNGNVTFFGPLGGFTSDGPVESHRDYCPLLGAT